MSRISAWARRVVFKRARNLCEYCQSPQAFCPDSFAVEHIEPAIAGGSDELDNLALACQGCNNHKYTSITGIDPVTGHSQALYHPRKNQRDDHFTWNADFTTLIGISPIGRATVERLNLNRAELINLRRILHRTGYHPATVDY